MKKCLRCGRIEEDAAVYCPSCGDSIFDRVEDGPQPEADYTAGAAGGPEQPPPYGQSQQPDYGQHQQPPYGQHQRPHYGNPQQAPYGRYTGPQGPQYYPMPPVKEDPVTIGDYLLFALLMLIPVFNIVYLIIVAVGGPRYKPSLTNFARASLILFAIGIVLSIILVVIVAINSASLLQYGYYY